MRQDVSNFYISIIKGDVDLSSINHMHIVLISKISNPCTMAHCQPISLCNVLFKIASKMLVNRFQKVLHLCID